jgi:hypothetical protein
MADAIPTAGQLAPPACGYANEQERFEAFVDALTITITGGIQWEFNLVQPTDLTLAWLKLDVDERPVAALQYSTADARYIRWRSVPATDGTPGGSAAAYTLTFAPQFTAATAYQEGRRYVFASPFTNSGPATLDVDGAGPVDILKFGGVPLVAGDIVQNQVVDVVIAGGDAWLQTPVSIPLPTAASIRALYSTTAEFSVPTSGTAINVANPTGVMPVHLRVVAVCKIGVDGYSIGDELNIEAVGAEVNSSEEDAPSYNISCSVSNITVSCQTVDTQQTYAAKTGGRTDWDAAVLAGSWTLKAYVL